MPTATGRVRACSSSKTKVTLPDSSVTRSSAAATRSSRSPRSGDQALKLASEHPPDLVILDLNLPVLGGLEVCRLLRTRPATAKTPIIMLTARTTESDRVAGLEPAPTTTSPSRSACASWPRACAPCCAAASRGRARARRVYRGKHLVADFDAVSIAVDGEPVRLTRREFELLRYLVENRNRVLSRDRLLERVWGYDRLIETRRWTCTSGGCAASSATAGKQIETVVGLGYRFVEKRSP